MKKILLSFRHSLFTQISAVLIAGSAIAFLGLYTFQDITENSTGKGSAINVAGSLRMQSYVLALTVARSAQLPPKDKKNQISEAVAEFERRLSSPGLTDAIPETADSKLRRQYDSISQDFYGEIKPYAEDVINSVGKEQHFLNVVPGFVSQIDAFVSDLEKDLEAKTQALQTGLIVLMISAVILCYLVMMYLKTVLFEPLANLAQLASEVRSGDFSKKSSYRKKNEIGTLASSMNFMIRDLSRLYTSLEDQVREKTADLNQQKETIELLYELKNILFSSELSRTQIEKALHLVLGKLRGECSVLSFRFGTEEAPRIVAETGDSHGIDLTEKLQGLSQKKLLEYTIQKVSENNNFYTLISVPAVIGALSVNLLMLFKKDTEIKADRTFMKNICREFAQALDSSNKNVESKRLALYEERSTIARELHDSIAQSLAFSRIQITLLNNALNKGISSEKTNKILDELNLGIQTAYKQLRSVLTTFRMKPESSDLRDNILTALDQFKERSGIPFTLQNEMQSFELGANQQSHLLQIIREALTNIEKHARAQHVFISIQNTGNKSFRLTVRDDGIGISSSKKDGHYGLEIMAERAKVLGGSLSVHSVIPHGTEVTLDFTPIV